MLELPKFFGFGLGSTPTDLHTFPSSEGYFKAPCDAFRSTTITYYGPTSSTPIVYVLLSGDRANASSLKVRLESKTNDVYFFVLNADESSFRPEVVEEDTYVVSVRVDAKDKTAHVYGFSLDTLTHAKRNVSTGETCPLSEVSDTIIKHIKREFNEVELG